MTAQTAAIRITKGSIVGRITGDRFTPVTLVEDAYVEATRDDDGSWAYSVGNQRYCCAGGDGVVLVATKIAMALQHTCSAELNSSKMNRPCQNAAKAEIDGKWYCGIHAKGRRMSIETSAIAQEQRARDEQARADQKRINGAFSDLLAAAEAILPLWVGMKHPDDHAKDFDILEDAIAKARGLR